MVRNDAYWGDKPAWSKVTIRIMTKRRGARRGVRAGDVQMIDAVPTAESRT